MLLKIMTTRFPAGTAALFLNSPLSKPLIKSFIKKNEIDVTRYEERPYRSYNDFFTRKQKDTVTVFNPDSAVLAAPCDSRLSAYEINEDSVFCIKDSLYKTADLLDDAALASRYSGGYCLIFRLCVDNYHRYSYVDDGPTEAARLIRGVLHTVQPIALERYNIYKRNTRTVTLQKSAHFGTLAYIEVGAMLIGRICNHHTEPYMAKRGEEKGYFEYGGSTVVLLVEKEQVRLDADILQNTQKGLETVVRLGEAIGKSPRDSRQAI